METNHPTDPVYLQGKISALLTVVRVLIDAQPPKVRSQVVRLLEDDTKAIFHELFGDDMDTLGESDFVEEFANGWQHTLRKLLSLNL